MGAKVSCAQTGFVREGLGARELRAGEACLCVGIVYAGAVCVDTVCALDCVCGGAVCVEAVRVATACTPVSGTLTPCVPVPCVQRCRVCRYRVR